MSFKPMKAKDFSVPDVKFSPVKSMNNGGKMVYLNHKDDSKIYLKTPEMSIPFDSGNFSHNKYMIQVNLDDGCADFRDKLMELDARVMEMGIENSVAWFKKKTMTPETIENVYRPMVKLSRDKETGEPNGEFDPKFQFKIPRYDGLVKCRCFDSDKKEMNVNDETRDDYVVLGIEIPWDDRMTKAHEGVFKRGSTVKGLLRCIGVYLINGTFGCTWAAEQVQVKSPVGTNYDFLADSDEEDDGGPGVPLDKNFVDSSSDEDEEDEGGDLSRQVSSKK